MCTKSVGLYTCVQVENAELWVSHGDGCKVSLSFLVQNVNKNLL